MKWGLYVFLFWFFAVVVSLASGMAICFFLYPRIGLGGIMLVYAIGFGALIIIVLVVLGIFATRNYLRDRKTHRRIQQRLHDAGLPK